MGKSASQDEAQSYTEPVVRAPQTWSKQGTSVAVGEHEAIVLAHSQKLDTFNDVDKSTPREIGMEDP